jgi:hypothetical protein
MLSDEKMKDFSIKEKVCISAQVQTTTGVPIALTLKLNAVFGPKLH